MLKEGKKITITREAGRPDQVEVQRAADAAAAEQTRQMARQLRSERRIDRGNVRVTPRMPRLR